MVTKPRKSPLIKALTPQQTVDELNKDVIGQLEAKKAVAIALRNRERRQVVARIDDELAKEIVPKNILMVGPTGVGKTEIARRIAKLVEAPFVKVEATKFTEVGYVGKDVDSIIRDLVENAIKMLREKYFQMHRDKARELALKKVVSILMADGQYMDTEKSQEQQEHDLMQRLIDGEFDAEMIDIEVTASGSHVEIMTPPGMEEMASQLEGLLSGMNKKKKDTVRTFVKDAIKELTDSESAKMINNEELQRQAVANVENSGIVFLDEIDKIIRISRQSEFREGVQRDLLPLIEGTVVHTKYGYIKTDHILFIASGAFLEVRPSDLISELQGRLPIKVRLDALTAEDLARILTEPRYSLTIQYAMLMKVEGIATKFSPCGVESIAKIAARLNEQQDNLGARRLHEILEKLFTKISFDDEHVKNGTLNITHEFLSEKLPELFQDDYDDSRWVI